MMPYATILAEADKLSPAGWTMMIGCISAVCLLVAFCFYRVLREPSPGERHHAPLDIDTHDRDS